MNQKEAFVKQDPLRREYRQLYFPSSQSFFLTPTAVDNRPRGTITMEVRTIIIGSGLTRGVPVGKEVLAVKNNE